MGPRGVRVLPVLLAVLAVLGAVALGGCGGGPRTAVRTEVVPYSPEQAAARETARSARYRLRPGDRFKIVFKYESDLNQDNLLVLPDGYISIGGLGTVQAAGLTVQELTDNLTRDFGRDYRDPELAVIVQEITSPEVYVLGEVERPGLYKMPDAGVGMLQAVAMAGGFTKGAKTSQTVLLRATDAGFMTRTYDLSHVQDFGIEELSYMDVRPYDIVFVPQTSLSNVSEVSQLIFGPLVNVSRLFWDIYAIANIEKIDRIAR